MPLIYVTGVPSTGKSTVREELLRRGYAALGGAEDGLAAFYDNVTGERIDRWIPVNERTPEWSARHTWKINRETIEHLKNSAHDKPVFICATTANDTTELWDLFDIKIALTIDEKTLRHRIVTRTNNDVGKRPNELREILKRQQTAEKEFTNLGVIIIDGTKPIGQVVDEIIANVATISRSAS